MGLFDWVKKKVVRDETVFCTKCDKAVKLEDFSVTHIGFRLMVEGKCPTCRSAYLKPHLPPDKYK